MSEQGDYVRSHMDQVTTFNQALTVVADAFDLSAADETTAKDEGDNEGGSDDEYDAPAPRSRSPAPRKKVKHKATRRRRY